MVYEVRSLYAALDAQLQAMGLSRFAEQILTLAQPAITLSLTRTVESEIDVGASKVGGVADLPPDVDWPTWRGWPLPFIGQVRMEEIAPLYVADDLPSTGLLSFFYSVCDAKGELSRGDDPAAWRVLYTADTTHLIRQPLPEELRDGLSTAFPACAVAFGQRLTLPDAQMIAIQALDFTSEEEQAYFDVMARWHSGANRENSLYLLGYPENLQGNPFYEAYLGLHRIPRPISTYDFADQERHWRAMMTLRSAAKGWKPWVAREYRTEQQLRDAIAPFVSPAQLDALAPVIQDLQPSPEQAENNRLRDELTRQAEKEWRLLFQVDSNAEAGMDWEGGGLIYFVVPRADLGFRDFSRVWVTLDFL